MEALIILLAEVIFVPLTALLSIVFEAVLTAIGGMIQLIFMLLDKKSRDKIPARVTVKKTKPRKTKARPWLRKLNLILIILLFIIITSVFVINQFFFEPATRFVLTQVKSRTNIEVTYSEAQGNLLSGKILLKDAEIKREDSEESHFDIKAGEFYIDLDMWSVFFSQKRIEEFRMNDAEGSFTRIKKVDRIKTREYVIEDLSIENLELQFSTVMEGAAPAGRDDAKGFLAKKIAEKKNELFARRADKKGNTINALIEIEKLHSHPLRSKLAVFDVLFRSNITGSINGHPFIIKTGGSDRQRQTTWQAKIEPLDIAAANIGGPLKYLSGGSLEVDVVDRWSLKDEIIIHTDWKVLFKNIEVTPPEDLGPVSRRISDKIVAYLEEHKEMSFRFELDVDESGFLFNGSISGLEMWKEVGKILMAEIGKQIGETLGEEKKQKIIDYSKDKLQKAKEFLEKRRKKKE